MEKNEYEAASEQKLLQMGKYMLSLGIVLLIGLLVMYVFLTVGACEGDSMEPTIDSGKRVIGSRFSYCNSEPKRGDIILFKHNGQNLIKRVIATSGEKVQICSDGVYINGVLLKEKYIKEELKYKCDKEYIVPENSYFVLGDNRNDSIDSRIWKKTFVEKKEVIAKVILIL